MSDYNEGSSDLSRRKVIRTLGTGVVTTGLSGAVVASSMDTVEYPKLISGDETIEYISVPKDWDQQRTQARRTLNRIRGNLHQIPYVEETQLEASEETFGGVSGKKIVALVSEDAPEEMDRVPTESNGIPLETRTVPKKFAGDVNCSPESTDDNCTNDSPTSDLPGGYALSEADKKSGSSCCKVTYNGSTAMLTVAHLFGETDSNKCNETEGSLTGRTAAVSGVEVGTSVEADIPEDWAIVDDSLGGNYLSEIDDGEGNPPVGGFVSKPTLDIWNSDTSSAPCLANMGRVTGRTTGKVKATNHATTNLGCVDFSGEGVKTYCNFAGGDSGSPTYYVSNGTAYMISVTGYGYNIIGTACGNTLGGQGAGTGAYHLAKAHGIEFGDNVTV